VDAEGGRRTPQVARRAIACAVVVLGATSARAQVARDSEVPVHEVFASCAGDGLPPNAFAHPRGRFPFSVQLSALAQAWGVAWVGRDVRQSDLDPADGAGLYLGYGRLGACGALLTPKGPLTWTLVYEPFSLEESAQPDHRSWGRIAAAEIGFAPWRWLTLSLGIRKIAFSYGHDEPLELQTLPIRPYVSQSVAPDRRAGITLDDDFGAAHIVIGVYQGARDLTITADGGMLLTARLVAEPIGPVGNTVSTRGDPAYWRARPRLAINASILYEYAFGQSTYALAADGALHFGPLGMVGEYIYASTTDVEAPLRHLPRLRPPQRQGLWVEAAVMLWRPFIEVAARFDWFDNPYQAGQRLLGVTGGLNLYGWRMLKLQAQYAHKIHYGPEPVPVEDDAFLLVGQLALERTF
jgi:hypothetical protein